MRLLKLWFSDLVGLLFPDRCGACETPLYTGESAICTSCLYQLPYTDYHLYTENRVARQFWGRVPVKAAMAMLYFKKESSVQRLIHQLKYKHQTGIGIYLGQLLGERLTQSILYKKVDLIIPVPLHPKKQRERGYNQSSCIAKGIATQLTVPVLEHLLKKEIETSSQTHKSRYERYENMKAVFSITAKTDISGKNLLLVDDVITTGATLEACANLLLENGAASVSIACLCFAD